MDTNILTQKRHRITLFMKTVFFSFPFPSLYVAIPCHCFSAITHRRHTSIFHSHQIKHNFLSLTFVTLAILSFSHWRQSTKLTGEFCPNHRRPLSYSVFATEILTGHEFAFAGCRSVWGGRSVSFSRQWSFELRRRSLMLVAASAATMRRMVLVCDGWTMVWGW